MQTELGALERGLVLIGAVLGAVGVAAAAGSSHGDAETMRLLGAIATIALVHAPALLVLGLTGLRSQILGTGAVVLATGALVFVGELALRLYQPSAVIRFAAPVGGMLMIGGWLLLAAAALFGFRRRT